MYTKLLVRSSEVSNDAVIWKYMDISKFISLISRNSLWLARADTFKDEHEGVFPLEMQQTLDLIYKKFEEKGELINGPINSTSDFQQYLIKNAYISCWHQNLEENMVMWEIYGRTSNSIAIRTTVQDLIDSLNIKDLRKIGSRIAFEPVIYENPEDVPGELDYDTPFFIKRPHFHFEKEMRLYLSSYSIQDPNSDTPLGYEIPINIDNLIKEIFVHPDAADWFLCATQALVDQFKLSKEVKKGLYGNKF